mgnify:CR=1 FL=1|jgi:hypothetical protein|tara:strand:+ start:109 stop:261 length:153 start_codon:yes stop_codon:yes gene_type:complete
MKRIWLTKKQLKIENDILRKKIIHLINIIDKNQTNAEKLENKIIELNGNL